jgi:hypothetical protein
MPNLVCLVWHGDAGDLVLAGFVEQAKLDFFRPLAKKGEVYA